MNKKYSSKNIFIKAVYSSLVGLPISMALTAGMMGFIYWASHELNYAIAAVLISMPFFIMSFTRMFLIDWVYQKYNVRIEPQYLIGRLIKGLNGEKHNGNSRAI